MKINPQELSNVLSLVSPGLCKRTILNQAKHFVFTGDNVVTFNDQISIKHPFSFDQSFSVPADELYSVVSKMKTNECELNVEDDKLMIKSKNTRSQLSISTDNYLISTIENIRVPVKHWQKIPDGFLAGLFFCYFSASKDMTQGALSCIAICGTKIYSSDNKRISSYDIASSISDKTILIPANVISELKGYDFDELCLSGSWIHLRNKDKVVFSCRILDSEFPDVESFFELKGIEVVFPDQIIQAIEDSSQFFESSEDLENKIRISADGKYLKCYSERSVGWVEKKVLFPNEVAFSFLINPIFFLAILQKTKKMIISVEDEKCLFLSENFHHIMCLPPQD